MESLLRNILVQPVTSRQLSIVFTGSELLVENAFLLLNETELSKMNAKCVFLITFYVE